MNFSKQKNGYCEKEVDEYISLANLKFERELAQKDKEISSLKQDVEAAKAKENSVALALTAAIDKAKDIEESSQKIYKLKLEQLSMLYAKWEILLSEMIKKAPDVVEVTNIKEDMENLKTSIKSALKDDFNIELITKTPTTDPIRHLLNKLMGTKLEGAAKHSPVVKTIQRNNVSSSQKTELEKLDEKTKIKPISSLTLEQGEEYENLVDKFLDSDEKVPDTFARILNVPDYAKNQGAFDLNEAINPKEDLEEIMKSFDFYNENN